MINTENNQENIKFYRKSFDVIRIIMYEIV